MKSQLLRLLPALALLTITVRLHAAETADPSVVKSYLLKTVDTMHAASLDFVKNAGLYQNIIAKYHGDYVAAWKAEPVQIKSLVESLRDEYKAMDSYGYETVEGIVAGVTSLVAYDVYLDSGVPKKEASTDSTAAPVTLQLGNGQVIDQEGCLFTYIIEPMLWGANPQWCAPVDLDGDGKIAPRESLPKTEIVSAAGADVSKKIGELLASSEAWQPTVKDCFDAIITMTPTFPGYFEDWKESRYDSHRSGLFSAVSRVSDMRGIMASVQILYRAVDPLVLTKDQALSRSIQAGFVDVMQFVDKVGTREKESGGKLTVAEIEEMAHQATEKADKIVPQVEQAAALAEAKK